MIKNFKGKYDELIENTITRFESGGLLTGDIVKVSKNAMKNPKVKDMTDQMKNAIQNAMDTDLNLRVGAVKSIRPNSTGNYGGGFGHGSDAPTDFWVDVVVEYAPGLWRDPITVPMEILERIDTGVNMGEIPDSMKRDSEVHGPEELTGNDKNRKTPTKNTSQKAPKPQDGRDQVGKPVEDKREKSGKMKKESVDVDILAEGINPEKVNAAVKKYGARKVAIKVIDAAIGEISGTGFGASDLPDSPEYMNGIDGVEEFLKYGEIQSAVNSAKETAREMLAAEGFPFDESNSSLEDVYGQMITEQTEQIVYTIDKTPYGGYILSSLSYPSETIGNSYEFDDPREAIELAKSMAGPNDQVIFDGDEI